MATETKPEITDADLRDIAAQLDRGELSPDSEVDITSDSAPEQAESKPEGSVNPEAAKTEVTQESQDQSPQKEDTETQAEVDYKAEYERLKKEQDRKDRSWERLEAEKKAVRSNSSRDSETRISGDQFSAEEYEQYAEKQAEEGNVADAKKAMTRAREIRQQAFRDQYQESVREAIDEEPELANQASDLAKAVQAMLNDPSFGGVPKGFKNAVRLAKAEKLAGSIPGLRGEIEQFKKEILRLNKAMEIGGSAGVPKRMEAKSFSDMSISEQGAYLRQKASESDDSYYN